MGDIPRPVSMKTNKPTHFRKRMKHVQEKQNTVRKARGRSTKIKAFVKLRTDSVTRGTFTVVVHNAGKMSDPELQDVVGLGWDVDLAAAVMVVHFLHHGLVCALNRINNKLNHIIIHFLLLNRY